MKDLDKLTMSLIEKSIIAINNSIDGMNKLDIDLAIDMYNTVLSGFESLEENRANLGGKRTIVDTTLEELKEEHEKIVEMFEKGNLISITANIEGEILSRYKILDEYYKEKSHLLEYNINIEGKYYKMYKQAGLLKKMDKQVTKKVQDYWEKNYGERIDPSTALAFYNLTGRVEPRVIPQEVLNNSILPILNGLNFNGFYSDKNVYDLLINADSAPEVVLKRVNGQYFDSYNNTISRSQAFQIFFNIREDLIVK